MCLSEALGQEPFASMWRAHRPNAPVPCRLALVLQPWRAEPQWYEVCRVNIREHQLEQTGLVLVVDDDAEMRDMLATWLACEGITPLSARHGSEALELLRSGCRPDVILLDMMMPVMDGWTFLAEQHRRPNLVTIPVIVVSAVSNRTARWPASVAAVVPKPCDLRTLGDAMRSVSGRFHCGLGTV